MSYDPGTDLLTPLFNPRIDHWNDHFRQDLNGTIHGLTAIGRTTLYVFNINNPRRVELRAAIASLDTLDR